MESAAVKVGRGDATDLRNKVGGVLRRANIPKSNLSCRQRGALKSLKRDKDIVILPADKGNATVVMDRTKYDEKMGTLIDTPTYKKLSKDPTKTQEAKVLKILRNEKAVGRTEYEAMRPSASRPPMIYGLPKVHKDNIPLRPIVSCIGSPTYRLAKHLVHIIGPLAGQTPSFVKNSRHFVEIVRGETIDSEEKLVSFDVESLFTNVPVEESITIIKRRLQEDNAVEERTTLSRNTVVDLLDLCLKSTYFQYKGEFYQQVDGAAMGSPVSPIVANIYMEEFEHQALKTAPKRLRLWKRYVDDTFCIVKRSSVEGFLAHLNTLKPTIRFTKELETQTQGRLPFSDTCLQRHSDATLVTSVYRKPTHTDRYLQYNSHHPTHVKRGVVRCLFERA